MKKVLPILSLLSFLTIIAACIAHIIVGIEPTTTMLIIFIAIALGVCVLMGFTTRFMVKGYKQRQAEPAFVGLVVEEPEEEKEDDGNVVLLAADDDNDDDDDDSRFAMSRYKRSFVAKLIQSDDELKSYYSTVKNAFMSYQKVTSSISREHERIRRGRATLAIIKVRGKTLLVYLALDPAQFADTMYVGEDVSEIGKYADVPFLYRVKGPRKAARTVKLIEMIAEKFGLEATETPANEDYVALYPYEDTLSLVKKGLIIDNVEEAEKRAAEKRAEAKAAEIAAAEAVKKAQETSAEDSKEATKEAKKAAEEALKDAQKAKEDAEKATERAAQTRDAVESAEEAKAAAAANEATNTENA